MHALGLLDTPGEERFDSVVRLAARLFQVPITYVALLDKDRQWFKSQCGMSYFRKELTSFPTFSPQVVE